MADDDPLRHLDAETRAAIEREVAEDMAKPTLGGDLTPIAEAILQLAEKHDVDRGVKEYPALRFEASYCLVVEARRFLGRRR
jgi:hypothetical protein